VQAELGLEEMIQLGRTRTPLVHPAGTGGISERLEGGAPLPRTGDRDLRHKLAAHYNARYDAALDVGNFLTGNG